MMEWFDKIKAWSDRYDKLTHFLGCWLTAWILMWFTGVLHSLWISLLLWLLVEVYQYFKYGWHPVDTIHDIISDIGGLSFGTHILFIVGLFINLPLRW